MFDELDDAGKLARFRREAVAAARVDDPRIVTVYESGDVDGVPFIAMRLVPGPSLAELVARFGALPPQRAVMILDDVASAVDAAHEHGLVHRDIKPANVLLDLDDRAYLSDFGVARMDDLPGLTRRGDWLGTVEYISPEQAAGHGATAASDIYAFGVLAFEVLCGRPPFVHRQASAVLLAHVREHAPSAAVGEPAPARGRRRRPGAGAGQGPPGPARARTRCRRRAAGGAGRLGAHPLPSRRGRWSPERGWTRVLTGDGDDGADAGGRRRGPDAHSGAEDLTRVDGAGTATLVAPVASARSTRGGDRRRRGRGGRRRVAVVSACAALLVAGGAGRLGGRAPRGEHRACIRVSQRLRDTGCRSGAAFPAPHPGQFRVVHVDAAGKAEYVGKPFRHGRLHQGHRRQFDRQHLLVALWTLRDPVRVAVGRVGGGTARATLPA